MNQDTAKWPVLPPLSEWQDTVTTVHMWTQVVGKVRLSLERWLNHSWGSALYLTTRGLTTSTMPYGRRALSIDFDFVGHTLRVADTTGKKSDFALEPMTVASFYQKVMNALKEVDAQVEIFTRPVEVQEAIPFEENHRDASYDVEAVEAFWQALVQVQRVFTVFRSRFVGKVSPVHFFWGAFDLAVTRFSGRDAPKHPGGVPNCADWVMEEAYSHEVSSAGFWPGPGVGEAAFYSYAYPAPSGFADYKVEPAEAYYADALGEFVLPYEAVRTANDPDRALLAFLQSTYEAGANLGSWDREKLEREQLGK